MEIIEYVRKSGRKPKRDENGHIIVKGNAAGRQKKGVLFASNDPINPDNVILGFSICSNLDDFDYVNGQHEPGFGLELAKARAEKWSDYNGYFVQMSWTEDEIAENTDLYMFENPIPNKDNPDEMRYVEVPPSIYKHLRKFVDRCKNYFKDKNFPEWAEKITRNEPFKDMSVVRVYFDNELGIGEY